MGYEYSINLDKKLEKYDFERIIQNLKNEDGFSVLEKKLNSFSLKKSVNVIGLGECEQDIYLEMRDREIYVLFNMYIGEKREDFINSILEILKNYGISGEFEEI